MSRSALEPDVAALLQAVVDELRGLRADLRGAVGEPQPEPARPDDILLCARDVASFLGISDRGLRTLRAKGGFPEPVRVGTRPRWRRADVDAWIAKGARGSRQ